MLSSGKLSQLYTQAPHTAWKAAALGMEENSKEANSNSLIVANYLVYVLSILFHVPLEGLPNQQNSVSTTWAYCPPKLLNVVLPAATTHWLHQACGSEGHLPSLNNLRSGPRNFIASHNQCDTINSILHSSALPFHMCLSKCSSLGAHVWFKSKKESSRRWKGRAIGLRATHHTWPSYMETKWWIGSHFE